MDTRIRYGGEDYRLYIPPPSVCGYGWLNTDGTWSEFIEHPDGRIERFLRVNGVLYEDNDRCTTVS